MIFDYFSLSNKLKRIKRREERDSIRIVVTLVKEAVTQGATSLRIGEDATLYHFMTDKNVRKLRSKGLTITKFQESYRVGWKLK